MDITITIPDPLAEKVEAAAKSHATSLEDYVVGAVEKTVAGEAVAPPVAENGRHGNPLIGFLADQPELADFICENAYKMRGLSR